MATTRAAIEALAVERTVEDDAAELVGVVDVSPEERGVACVRLALGRSPTPEEATGASARWLAEWTQRTERRGPQKSRDREAREPDDDRETITEEPST